MNWIKNHFEKSQVVVMPTEGASKLVKKKKKTKDNYVQKNDTGLFSFTKRKK